MHAYRRTRRLDVGDLAELRDLRRRALEEEPGAFASAPEDDRLLGDDAAQMLEPTETQALFGAFDGERLVGMAGILRLTKAKLRHRADLWGMYVNPGARGAGLGRLLLDEALAWARAQGVAQVHLGVTEAAPGARRLYEAAGFHCWGTEPTSLRLPGRVLTIDYLVLAFPEGP